MARSLGQIDFKRYGTWMLTVALVMGLWLSLDFLDCTWRGFIGLDLGKLSETKRFDKEAERRGTYQEAAGDGVGFMETMINVTPICVNRANFRAPLIPWYGFRIAGGLGLFLMLLNLIFRPKWKKELRERSKGEEEKTPSERRAAKPPPPEKIDLD